jgi:hypothetical protein
MIMESWGVEMNFLYYYSEQFKHKRKVIFSGPDLIMYPKNLSEIQKEAPDRSYFESGYWDRVLVFLLHIIQYRFIKLR